jgi:hypothetical protein
MKDGEIDTELRGGAKRALGRQNPALRVREQHAKLLVR